MRRVEGVLKQGCPVISRSHILLGGLCGLAWATGLRGFMAQMVDGDSTVS